MKEKARILDATAANRCMWTTKDSPHILWIDIEPDLTYKPDRLLDCTETDYPDEYFKTIFFDPPHEYGREKNQAIYTTPSKEVHDKKWPQHIRKYPRYYGLDKYATKGALLNFIHKAAEEFNRILEPDGMLWFKWSENRVKLHPIIPLFKARGFIEMMKIPVKYSGKTKNRTWWVLFMKDFTLGNKE